MALVQYFTDTFDATALAAAWGSSVDAGVTAQQINGGIKVTITAVAGYGTISSATTYSLVGSTMFTQLVSAGNQALEMDVVPIKGQSGADTLFWNITGNFIVAHTFIGGVDADRGVSVAYNAAVHRWFRIREAAGTIFWDWSTDGRAWTNHASLATSSFTAGVTALQVQIQAGIWGTAGTTSLIFDNFNVFPDGRYIPVRLANRNVGPRALRRRYKTPYYFAAVGVVDSGNVTVTPDTVALTTTTFAPILNLTVIPGTTALTTTTFAPQVNLGIIPSTLALVITSFAPVIKLVVTPTTTALTLTSFAPQVNLAVIPPTTALSLTTFAPQVNLVVTPTTTALTLTTFAPVIAQTIVTGVGSLTLTSFAPQVNLVIVPSTTALSITTFAPVLNHGIIPDVQSLTIAVFAPVIAHSIITGTGTLTLTTFAPQVNLTVTPETLALVIATFAPTVSIPVLVTPSTAPLSLATFAPSVPTPGTVTPDTLALSLTIFAPTVSATAEGIVPQTAVLVITMYAPEVQGVSTRGRRMNEYPVNVSARYLRRNTPGWN